MAKIVFIADYKVQTATVWLSLVHLGFGAVVTIVLLLHLSALDHQSRQMIHLSSLATNQDKLNINSIHMVAKKHKATNQVLKLSVSLFPHDFLIFKDCDGTILWFVLAHPDLKRLSGFLVVNHPVGTCSWVLKEQQL